MKYAVEMGSSTMICIARFTNMASGIQISMRGGYTDTHKQYGDFISLLLIFFFSIIRTQTKECVFCVKISSITSVR
jgi:hypothetical protein